jgi:hypothetical protein
LISGHNLSRRSKQKILATGIDFRWQLNLPPLHGNAFGQHAAAQLELEVMYYNGTGFGYTTDADGVRVLSILPDLVKMVSEAQRRIGQIDVEHWRRGLNLRKG